MAIRNSEVMRQIGCKDSSHQIRQVDETRFIKSIYLTLISILVILFRKHGHWMSKILGSYRWGVRWGVIKGKRPPPAAT